MAHPVIVNGSCRTAPPDANSTFMRGIVCSTVIACRPIPIVPSFGTDDEGTVKVRLPGPVPDNGAAIDNPAKPDGSIVHAHPADAGIVSVPVPPDGPNTVAVAVASNPHGSVTTAPAIQLPDAMTVTDVPSVARRLRAEGSLNPISTTYAGVPEESRASRAPARMGAEPMTAPSAAFSSRTALPVPATSLSVT
jgi:hypothetical protein